MGVPPPPGRTYTVNTSCVLGAKLPVTQRLVWVVPSRLRAKRRRRAEAWWEGRKREKKTRRRLGNLVRKVVLLSSFPSLPKLAAPAHQSSIINKTIRDDWGRVRRLAALLCVTQRRRCGIFPSDKRRCDFLGNTSRPSKAILKTRLVVFNPFFKLYMPRKSGHGVMQHSNTHIRLKAGERRLIFTIYAARVFNVLLI